MRFIDRTGQKFGSLTVLRCTQRGHRGANGKQQPTKWLCLCDCGVEVEKPSGNLTSGNTKSCGAPSCDLRVTHGLTQHPLYWTWANMVARCHNTNHQDYPRYGARAISVCDNWRDDVAAFITWVEAELGPKPSSEHTLDRRDNDGNYEPSNLRWANYLTQNTNRRNTPWVHINGTPEPLSEACRMLGMPYKTVWQRLKAGWSEFDALHTPVGQPRITSGRALQDSVFGVTSRQPA